MRGTMRRQWGLAPARDGGERRTAGLSWRGAICYRGAMLELTEINDLAYKAASAALHGQVGVLRVISEPMADSDGQDALRVTIVLKRGGIDNVTGDGALNTIVGVGQALSAAREDRFPIIDFVTEEELEADADLEC